jgi:hypothetical protein
MRFALRISGQAYCTLQLEFYGYAALPKRANSVILNSMNCQESLMNAIAPTLIQKLQRLPQQRLAEVEDFVEFLVARETRSVAGASLEESFAKLDKLNLPQLTDEEIDAEIQAARKERARPRG